MRGRRRLAHLAQNDLTVFARVLLNGQQRMLAPSNQPHIACRAFRFLRHGRLFFYVQLEQNYMCMVLENKGRNRFPSEFFPPYPPRSITTMTSPIIPTNPVFPYTCTRVINLDRLVLLFTVQSLVADRCARLLRPSSATSPVVIRLETVGEALGKGPAPLMGTVGSPYTSVLTTPFSYLNQQVPFQIMVDDPILGALVLGAMPDDVVSTTPVGAKWAQAPMEFPPAIPAGAPAWLLVPACGRVARTFPAPVYTGMAYSIVDNTPRHNQLRAVPISTGAYPGDVSTMFTLAWCPPTSTRGYPLTITLAWPGSTSVPIARPVYEPVVPRRCPRPITDTDPLDDPTIPFGRCNEGPLVRPLTTITDPLRLPIHPNLTSPRPRKCYPPM